jgi:4-hydroxy-3-methylbut-2-enyl diphosphate reductase
LLTREGYQVIVVGEAGHPEVEGTVGHAPGAVVVGDAAELDELAIKRRVGVVVQTTMTRARLQDVVDALIAKTEELRLVNTICEATSVRQHAAAELATEADVMVVIGGRISANTTHLAEICAERCAHTHHIESAEELEHTWFDGAHLIGITAGASTPNEQIDAVRRRIAELCAERRPDGW